VHGRSVAARELTARFHFLPAKIKILNALVLEERQKNQSTQQQSILTFLNPHPFPHRILDVSPGEDVSLAVIVPSGMLGRREPDFLMPLFRLVKAPQ
jgi:hypothetical protein